MSTPDVNEIDRVLGIFGRATTETYLDPSDRYEAIKFVRDYLFSLRERFLGVAQGVGHCGVTDAMCEAAVRADHVSRIQGFTYNTKHVIRDLHQPYDQQKIWEIDKNDADAEDKFHHQCRIEQMRKLLESALALPSTGGGTAA